MCYHCNMKLYLVEAAEFDRYYKRIYTYKTYMWAKNVSHVEETVKNMSERYTLVSVELITFKDNIDGTN